MNGASLDKLRKICGLLGSEHAGERASAALKATSMLREAGMTWGQVDMGKAASAYVPNHAALADYWEAMYRGEREQSERRAAQIQKLQREVARLKSMWPNSEPPKRRPAKPKAVKEAEQDSLLDYDKMLREKIAAAVEAAAAGELVIGRGTLTLFKRLMLDTDWSDGVRLTVEKALRWVYAKGG